MVIERGSQVQATLSEATHDHLPETLITRGKTAMRNVLRLLLFLLLTAATLAYAEDVRPGDMEKEAPRCLAIIPTGPPQNRP